MILAAGRGERLRPLTDTVPKPLIEVSGQALIFHHLDQLAGSGFKQVVINISHLGDQIREAIGDGSAWGLDVYYSQEPEGALETGGGIAQALPLLGDAPFLVINGDIYTDFPLGRMRSLKCDYAHLVLVPVPPAKQQGDFHLAKGRIINDGDPMHTFSGISVYHPRMFESCSSGRWSIVPLLRKTVDTQFVSGEIHAGMWHDTGTSESLERARNIAG